jgi:hypothetical protein
VSWLANRCPREVRRVASAGGRPLRHLGLLRPVLPGIPASWSARDTTTRPSSSPASRCFSARSDCFRPTQWHREAAGSNGLQGYKRLICPLCKTSILPSNLRS